MKSNVLRLKPPAAAAVVNQVEPLDAAVLEGSARLVENNAARRFLFSRLDELRGLSPLRRRRSRPAPPSMTAPVTFFHIEEADSDDVAAPLQVA